MDNASFIIISITSFASLLIVIFIFHKVKKIHINTIEYEGKLNKLDKNLYHQIEALISVYWELRPSGSFPSMRGWAASPDFMLNLLNVVKGLSNPQAILECSSGVSTIVLAQYIKNNSLSCQLISLDHDEYYANKTKADLKKLGLEKYAQVIYAPLTEYTIEGKKWLWYETRKVSLGYIDLLVVDGPPTDTQQLARFPALPVLKSLDISVANILMDDMIREDEKEILRLWTKFEKNHLVQHLAAEKGCVLISL
jgi:hypothetical protein